MKEASTSCYSLRNHFFISQVLEVVTVVSNVTDYRRFEGTYRL